MFLFLFISGQASSLKLSNYHYKTTTGTKVTIKNIEIQKSDAKNSTYAKNYKKIIINNITGDSKKLPYSIERILFRSTKEFYFISAHNIKVKGQKQISVIMDAMGNKELLKERKTKIIYGFLNHLKILEDGSMLKGTKNLKIKISRNKNKKLFILRTDTGLEIRFKTVANNSNNHN